jgi:hypothetical protein
LKIESENLLAGTSRLRNKKRRTFRPAAHAHVIAIRVT